MTGTSSVALVLPGCTIQLGRPWLSEDEICCANACETIDNGSSLAIESRDMMGDEVAGLLQSSFLTEEFSLGRETPTVVYAFSIYGETLLTAINPR
jgi:hypothetical protein